jgi:pimeloyl-ACP methyl ester carboxylesterase
MMYWRSILVGCFGLVLGACSSSETTPPSTGTAGHTRFPGGTDPLPPLSEDVALPIVFVHGFAGSAQQYTSQAMRFVANGYPDERIFAYEHDGQGTDIPGYVLGTVATIDEALDKFGVDKVYLVGHSRGTSVSSALLGNPDHAAKVAKYISLDGFGCAAAEAAAIPCIAPTQALLPGQAHVEVATSTESFKMQYDFLVGEPPEVVDIVPQAEPVVISGKAVNFPQNTGREGTTLEIYEIGADDGKRVTTEPLATFTIDSSGEFGPITVAPDKYYEFALINPEAGTQHFYMQRFQRSTRFVRLLSGPADSPIRLNTNRGPGHVTLIAMRMREWYGTDDADNAGDETDVLRIETTRPSGGAAAVDAITPRLANGSIAIHIHDDVATPKESTMADLPNLTGPFQTTSDVYMPAADPPDGTVTLTNHPRGDSSRPQVLHFPNWASSGHLVTVMFDDYAQN